MPHRHDIICISSIDWDFIWQGHQEIMSRLAADGHRVLFVENTGVRQIRMRDLGRVRHRIRNWWRGTKGFRRERPNLFVYSPIVLPLPYSRVAGWIDGRLMLRSLSRWMGATGYSRQIAWTFLPTPLARELIARLDPSLTIYHCVDEFASSSTDARRIVDSEEQLFRSADLVFVTSERLRERASRYSQRVHLFPSGVSLETFAVTDRARAIPADVASLPRPIVGYVGGLHQWVDQDLVADTAALMPGVVRDGGSAANRLARLEQPPNVHLLGQRPHSEVPGMCRHST